MSIPRKICVVTGTRAEYGLLYWTMKAIAKHPDLVLQVAVTGAHLSPEFGDTWRQIAKDGFSIDARVDMLLFGDDSTAMAKSTGQGTIGFADAYSKLQPDLVLLLGDRFEILAAAQAAMLMRIPVAHIHGGEVTEGAIDESIRHAITKMAYLHFVAAEPYRQRVVQLGEDPDRVHMVGAPGLDNLARLELINRTELEACLNASLPAPLFLVTYHPATLGTQTPVAALKQLLGALDAFPQAHILITGANADAGGGAINRELAVFAKERDWVTVVTSLGQVRYLSALILADVIIGNSSSGLIEAPSAGTPTVNIGDRQKGRLLAPSVLNCAEEKTAIQAAIAKSLSGEYQKLAALKENPYSGVGDTAEKIVEILVQMDFQSLRTKTFHDLNDSSGERAL